MEANCAAEKPHRPFRFWLGVLLVLALCLGSWLVGRSYGNREGAAHALALFPKHSTVITKTYFVGDFKVDSAPLPKPVVLLEQSSTYVSGYKRVYDPTDISQVDFDRIMTKIQQECSPDNWEQAGGPGRISPFPLNTTLIVSGDGVMHSQIEGLLAKLRHERCGPNFDVQYRGVVRPPEKRKEASK